MSLKYVIDRFALVSGLEQEEISRWVFVIIDCIKYFESRFENKELSGTQKCRLAHACAVYAYYKYSLINFASLNSRFKAGDVEIVSAENVTDKAHMMWQQEKKEISDIVDFDEFVFVGVGA